MVVDEGGCSITKKAEGLRSLSPIQEHTGVRSESGVKQELVTSSESPLAASPVLSTTCVSVESKKLPKHFWQFEAEEREY